MAIPLAAILGGAQLLGGAYQFFKPDPDLPKYEIPASQQYRMALAAGDLSKAETARLPGYDIAAANIRQSTASGVQRVRETAGTQAQALGAAVDLAGREQDAFRDLAFQSAQYQAQEEARARSAYQSALQSQVQQEEQAMYYNQMYPQEVALQERMQERQAGMQNIMGGLTTGIGSLMQQQQFNQMMGGGQQSPFGTFVEGFQTQPGMGMQLGSPAMNVSTPNVNLTQPFDYMTPSVQDFTNPMNANMPTVMTGGTPYTPPMMGSAQNYQNAYVNYLQNIDPRMMMYMGYPNNNMF